MQIKIEVTDGKYPLEILKWERLVTVNSTGLDNTAALIPEINKFFEGVEAKARDKALPLAQEKK